MDRKVESMPVSCIPVCDMSALEVIRNRRFKTYFYDVWLLQGNEDDPSQVYVAEEEIDLWIEALKRAKHIIMLHKEKENNPLDITE